MKALYKEMQERLAYLESLGNSVENDYRIVELQLAIVRVQQIMLDNLNKPTSMKEILKQQRLNCLQACAVDAGDNGSYIFSREAILNAPEPDTYEEDNLMPLLSGHDGWVSVKDKLPQGEYWSGDVLVTNGNSRWVDCVYNTKNKGDEFWVTRRTDMTHWMPLPELPKK
jgi:hypothetical protein